MEIKESTLRLHGGDQGRRYVRLVGDGTREGTRLLEYDGTPVKEAVFKIDLSIDAYQGCAHGTFHYWCTDEDAAEEGRVPGSLFDHRSEFNAFVLFELPQPDRAGLALDRARTALRAFREAGYEAYSAHAELLNRLDDAEEAIEDALPD